MSFNCIFINIINALHMITTMLRIYAVWALTKTFCKTLEAFQIIELTKVGIVYVLWTKTTYLEVLYRMNKKPEIVNTI